MRRQILTAIFAVTLPMATPQAQDLPAFVVVDSVMVEQLQQTTPVLGRVVANQEGAVAARVSGPIDTVEIAVGDRVEQGDLLVRLDSTRLAIEETMAGADKLTAESELETARRELALLNAERERLENLQGSGAFSKARLDDKINEIDVAESRIEAASARLRRAEVELSYRQTDLRDAELRAPYPGAIVQKYVSAGDYVRVGDDVLELVNYRDVEIEADVPAERMAGLAPAVVVSVDVGSTNHDAVVRAIVPVENAMTRTRAVRFAPTEGNYFEAAAIGQSVTVELPSGASRDVVTVHKDAVVIQQGQRVVFAVEEDKTVRRQPIDVGVSVGNRFEVLTGLASGDLVVVRGNERLRPGQSVDFELPAEPKAPAPQENAAGQTRARS